MLPHVILVLMFLCCCCGENPAIQVTLTNKGLQYGKHASAGWIQDKLQQITLPDISGKIDILIGHVGYTLKGITVTKCDFPEPSVQFYPDFTAFKSSMLGLSIALTGGWRTDFGVIHDEGSFDMALFSVDLISVVELGKNPDGHLSVTSLSCDAQIGDLDIQFHRGASWIFQPFVDHYKGRIKSEIQIKICPSVEKSIEILEHHLQSMNVSFDVDQVLALHLPLTRLPVMDASSLNLGLKGEFYSIKTHADPPFEAQPFIMPEQPAYMLSVGLSEYTLNSATFGYYSAGLLQVLINDSMIPPSFPLRLNTSAMGAFIPQLPQMFPGLLMNLLVYAREAPMFSFQPGAVKLAVQVGVKASAIQPNGTQSPLFTLNVDSKFSIKVWIAGGRLKGSMMLDNLTLTLAATEVGPFKTDALESMVRKMMKLVVVTKLNEMLSKGIIVPRMKDAQLVNSVLTTEKGFIAFSSDAEVFPTGRSFN